MKNKLIIEFKEGTTQEKIDSFKESLEKSDIFIKVAYSYNRFDEIRAWAYDRGIYISGDPKTQYVKLQEEAGELAKAILKNDMPEIIDGIGDCVVVLTNLAKLYDLNIEQCITAAYSQIINRKGKMQNGTFIKDK